MFPAVFSRRDERIDPTPLDARALPDRPTIDEAQDLALDRALAAIDALLARSPWASMYLQATAARPPGNAAARARARQAIGAGIGLRLSDIEPLQAPAESQVTAAVDLERADATHDACSTPLGGNLPRQALG